MPSSLHLSQVKDTNRTTGDTVACQRNVSFVAHCCQLSVSKQRLGCREIGQYAGKYNNNNSNAGLIRQPVGFGSCSPHTMVMKRADGRAATCVRLHSLQ